MRLLTTVLMLNLGMLLSGCGLFGSDKEPPPPPPTHIDMSVQADSGSNGGSPVLLRIYELRDLVNFKGADFFALYDKEQATLAADLVRKREFLVKPGERQNFRLDPGPETQFIGVFAAFRQLDSAQWRASAAVIQHQTTALAVKLTGNKVAVESSEPAQAH